LTDELAGQLAQQTLIEACHRNLVPGRKSLTGGGVHSRRVQFRLPESLREAAAQRVMAEGVSVSELAREALEHYLASWSRMLVIGYWAVQGQHPLDCGCVCLDDRFQALGGRRRVVSV